jgi:transmembrane protein 231
MEGAVFVQAVAPAESSSLSLQGQLRLDQLGPLNAGSHVVRSVGRLFISFLTDKDSVINAASNDPSDYDLGALYAALQSRNGL